MPEDTTRYRQMIMDAGERAVAPLAMVAALERIEGAEYRMLVRVSNDVAVNTEPVCPPPNGPSNAQPGIEYSFAVQANDLHSDDVQYQWSFDGDTTSWIGPYTATDVCTTRFQWTAPDTAYISVRARDIFGMTGPWSDPLAVFVTPTCCDLRGDINNDGAGPDIADLVYLVSYMFQAGPAPPCEDEADIDGSGAAPDIADLVYLVTYMFQAGPEPEPCP